MHSYKNVKKGSWYYWITEFLGSERVYSLKDLPRVVNHGVFPSLFKLPLEQLYLM